MTPPARITPGEWWSFPAATLFLLAHAALASLSLRQQSVTIDEFAHLPAGLSHWQRSAFFVYNVNPPLTKMLAALPVLPLRPRVDYLEPFRPRPGVRQEWPFGERFMNQNRERYFDLFFVGRYPNVVVSVLGGWVVFLWSRQLFGPAAGVVGVGLWCFCPNVLAYAGLITPDIGAATATVSAYFAFWLWLRGPTWRRALLAGILLGVAQLTKFTLLVLYPVWVCLWLAWRFDAGRQPPGACSRPAFIQLAAAFLTSLVVLNLGYGCQGTGKCLGDLDFASQDLTAEHLHRTPLPTREGEVPVWRYELVRENRFRGSWLGRLPVPLPEQYVLGIDFQKRDFERPPFLSYLRGELRRGGWWYYYLYAMAVKLQAGTLALMGLAVVAACGWPSMRRRWTWELQLLLPAAALLALVSAQTGFNHHVRYVLPAWPLLFIWVSRVGKVFEKGWQGGAFPRRLVAVGALLCLAGNAAEAVIRYPHYLSYFNLPAGGPDNGARHLINSNLDWGQDLLFLRRWVEEHPEARPLGVAYFNFVDPSLAGLSFPVPPMLAPLQAKDLDAPRDLLGPQPGWYAVSANFVYGMGLRIPDGTGDKVFIPDLAYTYFQRFRPVAKAGYSIFIYHITSEEADETRRQLGLPP